MMNKHILDLTGEVCPVPLHRTQEMMASLPSPSVLRVETDFARAVRNITQWCARKGYPYELNEAEPGLWHIVIKKD